LGHRAWTRDHGRVRILVVDDEPSVRASLTRVLERDGYGVLAAADGRQALHRVAVDRPDAVVLDVVMPDLDGVAVVQALRRENDPTPVLLLTARAEVADRVRGLDAGADDYLPKPFALEELLARLRVILRRRPESPDQLAHDDLRLDTAAHRAWPACSSWPASSCTSAPRQACGVRSTTPSGARRRPSHRVVRCRPVRSGRPATGRWWTRPGW